MTIYTVLRPFKYEPKDAEGNLLFKRQFLPGDDIDTTDKTSIPTLLPLDWLIEDGCIKKK